jgi:Tfp pilus assembly major pilin PilA
MDIYTASMIWKRYLEFEVDEYEDLMETSAKDTFAKEAKKRIISLFHRQFSIPLIGNDRLLKDMDRILSSICDEADLVIIQPEKIQRLFDSSKAELDSRLVFEDYIQSEAFESMKLDESARLKSWRAYIALEINEHKYSRAQRLYERAVLNCQTNRDIWNDYLEFAISTLKSWSLVADVSIRMVKVFKTDIKVWQARFLALEHLNKEEELLRAYATAISSWFSSAEDYLCILFTKSSYYRRKIQRLVLSETTDLETKLTLSAAILSMRLSSAELEAFMEKYYESWFDGWLRVYLFQVAVEDEVIERLSDQFASLPTIPLDAATGDDSEMTFPEMSISSEALNVWERSVKRFGKNAVMWKEYIAWSRFHQSKEATRKLYKRMLSLLADNALPSYQDWLQFEYQVGSLLDIQAVWTKIQTIAAKEAIKVDEKKHAKAAAKDSNLKKRGLDAPATAQQDESFSSKRVRIEENSLTNATSTAHTADESTSSGKPAKIPEPSPAPVTTKIVVKNLSFNSTVDGIRDHFSSCGEVKSVDLLLAKSGRSRGIADINFMDAASVDAALRLHESILDGRAIHVERWMPDALQIAKPPLTSSEESLPTEKLTVFISRVSLSLSEDALKEFLVASCGEIADIKLAIDKFTKKSKVST